MKTARTLLSIGVIMLALIWSADSAHAWCNPRILTCESVIDSNTTQGHDDVDRFNCTGDQRFKGNAHVYYIDHPGDSLWIELDWEGDADADSALHLFLLGSCNKNDCIDHDPRFLAMNLDPDGYWIIVEGRRNAADGTEYTLRVYCGDNPLSVELSSFTALSTDNGVALQWSTASETNNDYFEIERCATGSGNWNNIAAVSGNGTSASSHDYTYLDPVFDNKIYDYRLTSVEFDGTRSELGTVTVMASGSSAEVIEDFGLMGSYPNPFNPSTTIRYALVQAGEVSLDVFDVSGRLIRTLASGYQSEGAHNVAFDGSDLSSGVYFARLSSAARTDVMKMILMK